MATVVSTPQLAYRAAPIGGTAMGQSANLSIATSTGAWEMRIPFIGVQPNTANISAGWEIYVYRSTDGGATFETIPTAGMSIARNPNVSERKTLRLDTGYWALRVISGGNVAATFSFRVGTIEEITAINNV